MYHTVVLNWNSVYKAKSLQHVFYCVERRLYTYICHTCAFCVQTSIFTFRTLICLCVNLTSHGPLIPDVVSNRLSEGSL